MMRYTMQEGVLVLPEKSADQTVNIFQVSGVGKGEVCNIVVNRDTCEADESLEAYVGRQLKLLGRSLRSMKEVARRETTIGAAKIPAIAIEIHSKDAGTGRTQYQMQALCKLAGRSVLLFTLTSPSPPSEALRADWQRILSSFSPHDASEGLASS
ncbi:MAG: DcrB-related protein [Desulfobulbaceae bacterium]|jgi:hypothetical protein|nr:DcrB-related protein [Desulfobulbaceae bacterium]